MTDDIDDLRARLDGEVFLPGDQGYASATRGHNTASTVAPDLVVVPRTEADVQRAVRYAAERNLPTEVMATGHGTYTPVERGMLVRTNRLTDISLDVEARVVTLGGGVQWKNVIPLLVPHGLVAITGSCPTVGAVGLVLGGGMGPLARTYGFSSDRVRRFRVVVADGSAVVADADTHADLFWALKGGKVGLGIVTQIEVELVELPTIYAGGLFFAEQHIEASLRAWVDATPGLPDEATTSLAIVQFPDVEGLPAVLRGRRVLHLRFAYVDPALSADERRRRAEELLVSFRAAAPVLLDTIAEIPATAASEIHMDPEDPGPVWARGVLLDAVDQDFATTVLGFAGADAPFEAVELRHLGGALAESPAPGGATGGGRSSYAVLVVGTPDVALFDTVIPAAMASFEAALEPYLHEETNYNWVGLATPRDLTRLWSGETTARLDGVRKKYDPEGIFAGAHASA